MRIVVTGGSGKGGRWVVRELRGAGHDVLNVDVRHDGSPHGQCLVAEVFPTVPLRREVKGRGFLRSTVSSKPSE